VVGVVIGLVVLLSGSSSKTTKKQATKSATTTTVVTGAATPTCPPTTAAGASKRVTAFTKAPPACISHTAVLDATVKTDVGTFVIQMKAADSYASVNNFVFLARYHFFDNTTFPRVIKGFVVQGGSPNDTTSGGPGYSFTGNKPPASCTAKKDCYPIWSVAMANSTGPSTNGSQFFIVLPGGQVTLDAEPNYSLFGQVIAGTSVVAKIGEDGSASTSSTGTPKVTHRIISVTISQGAA